MASLARQSGRLLQFGVGLLLYSSLEGFAIPYVRSQRVGLSAHTLAALQGVLLITLGVVWPRLRLGEKSSVVAYWCLIYSALAILGAYTMAAFWGVGNETIRLAGELPHGLVHGTHAQEAFIAVLAYSSAPTGVTALVLVLWGLRSRGASAA